MIQSLLKSLVITLTISALISGALYALGFNFIKTLLLVTAIQIGIWHVVSYVLDWRGKLRLRELEVQMLEEMGRQGAAVSCASCKSENFIPIVFGDDNGFECTECGKSNAVYVEIETAARTQPIDEKPNV